MLRITVQDNPGALTFQLEGRLAGPSVPVLEECWQSTRAGRRDRSLLLDLTGVTSIDAAGRACLAAMHRQGAAFLAADCLMKALVADLTQAPLPGGGRPKGEGESRPSTAACSPSPGQKGDGQSPPESNEVQSPVNGISPDICTP